MTLYSTDIFEEYPNPVFVIKPIIENGNSEDFEYVYANNAFCIFLGHSREELINHRFREYFEKGEKIWLNKFFDAAQKGIHDYVNTESYIINKKLYAEIFHVPPDMCGCIIHDFKTIYPDINELRRRADYDYLTGFYNRFHFKELYGYIGSHNNVGITFLDINDLKGTNDKFGHAAGDRLIVHVCDLIRSIYKGSVVFRFGGDEFLIITLGMEENEFIALSQKSQAAFEENMLAAIGYSYYEKIDDLSECIKQCDSLMYEHKKLIKELLKK